MLTKINFPREAIVLSGIYQVALNAVIKLIILLVIVSVLSGYSPAFGLFLFFIGSFTLVVAGTVVGLLLAPIAMLYSDVEKSLPFLLQFVMFLTPVVFLLPNGVLEGSLFEYNPLSYFIVALRQLLFSMEPSQVDVWLYWFGVSCVALLFFFVIFRISLSVLIERIGN
jgi:lipopolysaccharide transport system permease protein